MKDNVIQNKSYDFALRIVKLSRFLSEEKNEHVLSKQVLRSGTSIGANIEESIGGQSHRDFISKMSIAYKEARETLYWLRLLTDSDYLNRDQSESIQGECRELIKILTSILNTSKQNKTT